MKKKKMFYAVDCILIFALVLFTVLDTFVITRTYTQAAERTGAAAAVQSDSQAAQSEVEEQTNAASEEKSSGQDTNNADAADNDSVNAATEEESSESGDEAFAVTEEESSESGDEAFAVTEEEYSENEAGSFALLEEEEADFEKTSETVITETSYQDENISVSIEEYRYLDTTVYVADVQVSSIDYLYAAMAQNAYGKNVTETTSAMAEENDAILAINGDYYGARNSGYVLRNGTLYRADASSYDQEDLVIGTDGSFSVITEGSVSAADTDAWQIYSFGPALIEDGEISVGLDEEVGKAMASNPRTAVCEIEPLHYLFVVSDGRSDESEGLSLYELAQFLQSFGVTCAYNLDGGGSSTMVFMGEVINNPTTSGKHSKERSVSDAVCIGY